MKSLFLLLTLSSVTFASFDNLHSFKANFEQSITDEKNKVLLYKGNVVASKPQNALWKYTNPIDKDVYVNSRQVTIIEPEIEQAIIKNIYSSFDFFNMLKDAKEINKDTYSAMYKDTRFTIIVKENLINTISYIDEFENSVKIIFTNQKNNKEISKDFFIPKIPLEFDIIRD